MARFQSCSGTALAPWRTGRASAHALACWLLAGILSPSRAQADVAVVPAEDGQLGAWLVAGPLPGAATLSGELGAAPRLGAAPGGGLAGVRWRWIASRTGILDLAEQLEVKPGQGARAMLAGQLRCAEDLEGWLMLSVDGGASVWVDGQVLWTRDADRLRDRSWDVLPLTLSRGTHTLVFLLRQRVAHWAFGCRILERANLLPPKNLRLVLGGAEPADQSRISDQLRALTVDSGLDRAGFRPRVEVTFPGGFPAQPPLPVTVAVRPEDGRSPRWEGRLGSVAAGERGMHGWAASLPRLGPQALGDDSRERRWEVAVQVGSARELRTVVVHPAAPALVERAQRLEHELGEQPRAGWLDAQAVGATLHLLVERLALAGAPAMTPAPRELVSELGGWVTALERDRDPLAVPGVRELARWSKLDGQPTAMSVHVPASYTSGTTRRYPLVVLLHGYDGSPRSVMQAFLGSKSHTPHPAVDGFLVAPHAHGNSFYRGPGERDALDAIDWMLEHYPIDPERVAISGVSMGGTGAAHLGLRYADRFSRAAPLCGYQSYFLRRDVAHRPTRPWEIQRMHHWSPASWAPNGRHLPLWVAQGTRDLPLSNSRVLVDAYRALGYTVTDEWPDTGHAVWEKTYASARLWRWLSGARRQLAPARVTLATDALRYGALEWLRVTALGPADRPRRIEAERTSPDRVVVTTQGITAFELDREHARLGLGAVTLEVDGTALSFRAGELLAAHRDPAGWQPGALARRARDKRAGVEGPIDDAFLGPLVFVYGSVDPHFTRANREIAGTLARLRYGAQIRYPVVSDRELDPALEASHSLVLVGNGRSHALIRRIEAQLPIQVVGGAVRVGSRTFSGAEVGTTFIYPNPEHPDRYVLMVEGADIPGLYYALSLPQLLPDFAVYDSAVALAAGQQVLGAGRLLAAGFFLEDWSLPADPSDPLPGAKPR